MHSALSYKKSLFSAAVCALLVAAAPAKATIYDEAVSGDLSNDKAAPTALTLMPGLNSVSGTVAGFPQFGGTDPDFPQRQTYLSVVAFLFYHAEPRRALRRQIAARRKSDTETT